MVDGQKYRPRNASRSVTHFFSYHRNRIIQQRKYHSIRNNKRLNDEKLLHLCNCAVLTLQPTTFINHPSVTIIDMHLEHNFIYKNLSFESMAKAVAKRLIAHCSFISNGKDIGAADCLYISIVFET